MESLRCPNLVEIASTFHNIGVTTSQHPFPELSCAMLLVGIPILTYAGMKACCYRKNEQGEDLQKDKTELISKEQRLITFVRCGMAAFKDDFFVPAHPSPRSILSITSYV
jgi:hypothetical protein